MILYKSLCETGSSQTISAPSCIANRLRLLRLPEEVRGFDVQEMYNPILCVYKKSSTIPNDITFKEGGELLILTALAMALGWLERMIPLELLIPLPGVKLGLANTVTLFALYRLNIPMAVLILIARCLLGMLFSGNVSALAFSVTDPDDLPGLGKIRIFCAMRRVKRRVKIYTRRQIAAACRCSFMGLWTVCWPMTSRSTSSAAPTGSPCAALFTILR